jgi:aryl-alcohol dehydrogenase-like predicted oxidoreductase
VKTRTLGKTGLCVTPLGFGTAQIGFLDFPQPGCDRLLNGVLDAGVNVIDTAACYDGSEEKIGRAVSHRRDEFVLVSKCGHHVEDDDPPDWDGAIVRKSLERSLKRLRTDRVDVMLVHSCAKDSLENEDLMEALVVCKEDGLTRFVGYSGDNEALDAAIRISALDCLQTSVNICNQQLLDASLPAAREADLGVLAKRPIANSCWRNMSAYGGGYDNYSRVFTERLEKLGFTPESLGFEGDWLELALRFTVYQPGVHTALVGGMNLEHIQEDVELARKGPLPEPVLEAVRDAWKENDDGSWKGET